MIERGISEKEVQEGIKQGSKTLQKPNKILFNHKYYCIVAKKIKGSYYIITIKLRW
jgi:hypothetical protein